MAITRQEVEHVALLARLELTEEEINSYTEELNTILNFMDKLNELDTENVVPTVHAVKMANVFREDIAKEGLDLDSILQNAPERVEGQFKVPRIV